MLLLVLIGLSLIYLSNASQCSAIAPSYKAPYDLQATPVITINSVAFSGGTYYIHPCGTVDASLCPYSSSPQQCFATMTWELIAYGLGSPSQATWSPLSGNWTNGAVAINADIPDDYDQCNANPATNSFKVTYMCDKGNDQAKLIKEPTSDKQGDCIFEFQVDSSVVCAAQAGGGGGDGTCSSVAPSYEAPYDLQASPLIAVDSVAFQTSDGQPAKYYIQPCSTLSSSLCPYTEGNQQCFATVTWEPVSDGLGAPNQTIWSALADDWMYGAIAINNDIGYDYDQCVANPATDSFKVVYMCNQGNDRAKLIKEPRPDKKGPCTFEFQVDSSVVCAAQAGGGGGQCNAVAPSYKAAYDLKATPLITINSVEFSGGKYYIQPCGTVSTSVCPYSSGTQQCFATMTWELVSDGLGAPDKTTWSPLAGDWAYGAVAINTDVPYDYDQCNANPATNSVKVTYMCDQGNDQGKVVKEPKSDKNGDCIFEFQVDSSIVCAAQAGVSMSA